MARDDAKREDRTKRDLRELYRKQGKEIKKRERMNESSSRKRARKGRDADD